MIHSQKCGVLCHLNDNFLKELGVVDLQVWKPSGHAVSIYDGSDKAFGSALLNLSNVLKAPEALARLDRELVRLTVESA